MDGTLDTQILYLDPLRSLQAARVKDPAFQDAHGRWKRADDKPIQETRKPGNTPIDYLAPYTDLRGESYRQFTYNDLINKCKEKDRKIRELTEVVQAVEKEKERKRVEEEEQYRLGRLFEQNLHVGNLQIKVKGTRPPAETSVTCTEIRTPIRWPPRDVIVLSFDVVNSIYLVVTGDNEVFTLENATKPAALGQAADSEIIGKQLHLDADCCLVHQEQEKPQFRLNYRSHVVLPDADRSITCASARCGAIILDSTRRRILLLCERSTAFTEWKIMLRAYLVAVDSFERFAPEESRKISRRRINVMRDALLDFRRWRIHTWPYEKLLNIMEGRGFDYDNLPFTHRDNVLLENLNQEAIKAMQLFASMARKEAEQRLHAYYAQAQRNVVARAHFPILFFLCLQA